MRPSPLHRLAAAVGLLVFAAVGCSGDGVDGFRAIAVPDDAPPSQATTCELVRAGSHERALLPLLVVTVPEGAQPVVVHLDRVEVEQEALEVEDVAIYRHLRAEGDLGANLETMPILGYPLDDPRLLAQLRQDFDAISLPETVRLDAGQSYAVMATVSHTGSDSAARRVGYLRATAVHYEVDGHRRVLREKDLGLEGYLVIADAADRDACDDVEPRWE